MEYRTLGRTGVRVSTYALGTMMFGADGNPDEKECIDIVHAALDAGVNLIDTADTYSHGEAEDIVRHASLVMEAANEIAAIWPLRAAQTQTDLAAASQLRDETPVAS